MNSKLKTKTPIRILTIREKVVLDSDLAAIYGVTTGRFNEAVKQNATRFPTDFSFFLMRAGVDRLISQNAISKPARGGRTKLPRVFTEHGALMAANILNSDRFRSTFGSFTKPLGPNEKSDQSRTVFIPCRIIRSINCGYGRPAFPAESAKSSSSARIALGFASMK